MASRWVQLTTDATDRPTCPHCGRLMSLNGVKRGKQQYQCWYCRNAARVVWDALPVVCELPPAAAANKLGCEMRHGSKRLRCPFYTDCRENIARGGAVLCERVFVVAAGHETIIL